MEVYRQRVPGSSAVIYDVSAYYETISGSYRKGLVVADSAEVFRYSYDAVMPYAVVTTVGPAAVQFVSWSEPGGRVLTDTVTMAFTRPVGTERMEAGGVEVENVRYRSYTGSGPACGLREYRFTRFRESPDSLIVSGLTHIHGPLAETLRFRKGDVRADLDGDGFVEELTVTEFVAGLRLGYRTARRSELTEVPTTCTVTYSLTRAGPERQQISDYGVFKLVSRCSGDC